MGLRRAAESGDPLADSNSRECKGPGMRSEGKVYSSLVAGTPAADQPGPPSRTALH